MTNKQPEALRLADELDKTLDFQTRAWSAAKELRRLHELNAELVDALKEAHDLCLDSYCISAREVIVFALDKAEGK